MYSAYVEEQASRLFERLFTQELDVFSLIMELKKLKDSKNATENEIYHCTISNLYQEFRFLPQYPDSELFSTAALTGALVQNELVPSILLENFISKLKDCLLKPHDSKLHRFGLHALQYFPSKLKTFSDLCEVIQTVNPKLLEDGDIHSIEKPANCDMILVQLNNLTQFNVKEKAAIIATLIEPKFYGWFSEFCTSRAVQEPNYMDSYIQLFKHLGTSQYELLIRHALILVSKSFTSTNSEKNHYKNLGQWVGKLTLAQNRPLLWNELNLTDIIDLSTKNGLLKQSVTFICQLLKQVCNTMLRPKNPWTMNVISLLMGSLNSDNSTNHTKFELELLFKKLKLKPSDIEQTYCGPATSAISEINGIKEICHLACLITAKEFDDKSLKKLVSVARATASTLFEKEVKSGSDLLLVTAATTHSSLAYVLAKEYLRMNAYSAIKRIFLEMNVEFDDKDVWPVMITAIEDVSNFLYWHFKGSAPQLSTQAHDLISREYALFSMIMTDLPSNIELACHWEKSREALISMLMSSIKSCFKVSFDENLLPTMSVSNLIENIHLQLSSLEEQCTKSTFHHIREIPSEHLLTEEIRKLGMVVSNHSSKEESGLMLSQKLMQFLFKTKSTLFADILVYYLSKILESSSRIMKEVTAWILHSNDSRKFNELAILTLLKNGIVYILDFDIHLSRMIEPANISVIDFACNLCVSCLLDKDPIAAPYDMVYTLDALAGLQAANIDSNLIARICSIIDAVAESTKKQVSVDKSIRDSIYILFTEWFRISQYPSGSTKQQNYFVEQICQKYNFTDINELEVFTTLLLEAALSMFSKQLNSPLFLAYRSIDAFVKLAILIISNCKENSPRIIESVLQQIGIFLIRSFTEDFSIFIKPLSRIVSQVLEALLKDFKQFESKHQVAILTLFKQFFELVSPSTCPCFSLPWIELVGSRQFLSLVLFEVDGKLAASLMTPIIVQVGKFLHDIPPNSSCDESHLAFYKGALHLFLIIAHDVPDIFVNNHEVIVSSLPSAARQLRNLVLSSIPKNMKLPDPFNIKVASLDLSFDEKPELNHANYKYPSVYAALITSPNEAIRILKDIKMDSFVELCNVICDQLRYPSKFTTRNIVLVLSIYESSKESSYREAVICCILERLVSHKPHPWGLMVTFLELIRNEKYSFWSEGFINKSPEIRNLFDSIAKTCLSLKQ